MMLAKADIRFCVAKTDTVFCEAKADIMLCAECSTGKYFDFYIVNNFTLFKEKYKNNKCTYEFMTVFTQR